MACKSPYFDAKICFLFIFFIFVYLASMYSPARAEYTAFAKSAREISIRSDEPESDAVLRASCPHSDIIQMRLGAEFGVGKGKGERVKLRLRSGGRIQAVSGTSVISEDAGMTGGTELFTTLPGNSVIFAILSSGSPIRIEGSIEKTVLVTFGPTSTAALKRFISSCRAK